MIRLTDSQLAVLLLAGSVFAASSLATRGFAETLSVVSEFPGGSGRPVSIDQGNRAIHLLPASHANRGWECWWYVRIEGARPGERIELTVGEAPWATPDRAAISSDQRGWSTTAKGKRSGKRITYGFSAPSNRFWLAWGPPFVPQDARQLVREAAERPFASSFELCRTRAGRAVPGLRIWEGEGEPEHAVWVQARQHAWESGSSWVCRGLVEWLVSDDSRARRLRSAAALHIVPIMDLDSVAIGAGGKGQEPRDHNRDWSKHPHWPTVKAAMERIKAIDQRGRLDLFVDLHNPSASARQPFYFITPRELLAPTAERNLDRFLACSREEIKGPLPFLGETHESGRSYDRNWMAISKNWVSMNASKHVVALTLETAWNTPHSTTTGYQAVGRQLGKAIERYLRIDPRKVGTNAVRRAEQR